MSDFAFKMSKKDRKLAMGEKVSPADENYDPEGEEWPDPLSEPDSFVQQLLQNVNSLRRKEEFKTEDVDEFEGYLMDFLTTCSDPELGEEDLPGTGFIIEVMNTQDKNYNGISSVSNYQKESALPLAAAAAVFGPQLVKSGLPKIMPYVKKGLSAVGLSNALRNVPIVGNLFGGGGQEEAVQPIQMMNTTAPGMAPQASVSRSDMPFDHISDNLMFEAASGIKKKDSDIESLRAQVNSALTQWAKSGEVTENRAVWWALYSYAHEAETIAELSSILTAVPEQYHNSVLNTPVGLEEEAPPEGNTGLPEPSSPTDAMSPTNTNMSPIPIDGVGTPPKMPQNQQTLIPGAVAASHDSLRVKPVFASLDESKFDGYVEEDRPVLARVAAFMEAGTHESDIINTLYPSYGHEYTIWALEQVKRVASNDPLVDPSIVNMGIEWKEAGNDPHDLPEGMHQMDIMEVLEDVEKEKKEKAKKERTNNKFPSKGENVGANSEEKINQQETSGMITPQQEKVAAADYLLMNQELQHDEDALQLMPQAYLEKKLFYPYHFLAQEVVNTGDSRKAMADLENIEAFIEDYAENYLETAINNVYSDEVVEESIEQSGRDIDPMEAKELVEEVFVLAIRSLQAQNERIKQGLQMLAEVMPPEIMGNTDAMMQQLDSLGMGVEEFNAGIKAIIDEIQGVSGMFKDNIGPEIGFLPEDIEKSERLQEEQGVFADPRTIIKDPEDFQMDERDRRALGQFGIDLPRESKKKESDFTSLPNNTLAQTPSPYDQSYNQTMGIAQQTSQMGDAVMTQQAYQAGSDATPDPGVLGQLQQQQEEEAQLQEMYPNVPTDMTRQWLQRQQQQQQSSGHPMQTAEQQSSAGQTATNAGQGLSSATTSKVAAWKDVRGNVLVKDKLYKMTSSDYEIPDYVRIVNNGTRLDLYIPRGDLDVSLSESEIRQSNYSFEPIEKDSQKTSFLSESTLSTNEQRALIEEQGIARNMDRLNLEGTHYPTLMQTSKNDKIDLEEIPLKDFFIEDFDLFI